MSQMTDLESYRTDLIRAKYLTEYWDGKNSDYACTVYGMDRLLVWMQLTDEVKNITFQTDAPLITTEKKQYVLTEFIGEKFVTRIFKEGREEIVPTSKGKEWFDALLFWQDTGEKKKYSRNKKLKKAGFDFMSGLVKFTMELQKFSQSMNGEPKPKSQKKKKMKSQKKRDLI